MLENTHHFRSGTTFNSARELYIFDRKLRLLVLSAVPFFHFFEKLSSLQPHLTEKRAIREQTLSLRENSCLCYPSINKRDDVIERPVSE